MSRFDSDVQRFAVPGNLQPGSDPDPGAFPAADGSTTNKASDSQFPGGVTVPSELSRWGEYAANGNPDEGSEPIPSGSDRYSPGAFSGWPDNSNEGLSNYRFRAPGNVEPGSDPDVTGQGPTDTSY